MKVGTPTSAVPLSRIGTKAYERASSGSTSTRLEDSTSVLGIPESEFTPRVRDAIMSLMAEVETLRRDLSRTQSRLNELEKEANEDPLVPVSNRRVFVRELDRAIAHAQRYGAPASLIYLDLNGLKLINDRFGHNAGDAALRQVGDVLIQNIRRSDVVGRLGGDEFGVILVQADQTVAGQKAEQLASAIAQVPLNFQGTVIPLSVSYGCHTFLGGDDPQAALAAADQQMYTRKRAKI